MEEGFVKGQADNLPRVDPFMVTEFLNNNANYASAEIRGVKQARSARESYGNIAVGYVQVKRAGDICTVKAKITPEHKVKNKAYSCIFKCNEEEEAILSVECQDCAAHQGGCKHAVAFLFWLHRKSEEPSTTEKECYWVKPKLSYVGTSDKFIKAKDMGSKTREVDERKDHKGDFLKSVVNNLKGLPQSNQLMKYFCNDDDNARKLSLHFLLYKFKKQTAHFGVDDFLHFCSCEMSVEACKMSEKATSNQADSPLWHDIRYCRITASKAYEAAQCKTIDGVLVEQIFGAMKIKETAAMSRGKLLEKEVVAQVAKQHGIVFKKCGIFLKEDWPVIGASPDGITNESVIEIKCPLSVKSKERYVKNGEITNKYKAQIQLQMFFTGKEKGLFCVASENFEISKEIETYEILYDEEYCLELLHKCTNFWKYAIYEKFVM